MKSIKRSKAPIMFAKDLLTAEQEKRKGGGVRLAKWASRYVTSQSQVCVLRKRIQKLNFLMA